MAVADHPDVPFVQAAGFTRGRPDGPPLWIVWHDMEASEHSGRAESTAVYFADPGDGRSVSAHYCVDNDSVVQCVRLSDSAWTVGNRAGNNRGINVELAGYARQTREEWLDDFGRAMLAQAARVVHRDMTRYGIPARWCTVEDLRAYRPGLTTHNDLRVAFGGTTHTDPGPGFPRDFFLSLLTGDDMEQSDKLARPTVNDRRTVGDVLADVSNERDWWYAAPGARTVNAPPAGSRAVLLLEAVAGINAKLDALLGRPADDSDETAIVAGVLASLTPAAVAAAIPPEIAAQVANELAARLAG